MIPEKLRIDSIFQAAVEKASPEKRSDYLDDACGSDQKLRSRVERLLSAHPKMGSFLESPAPVLQATLEEGINECTGFLIGPYKLLEQIGEGGMGVVYVAEQTSPVRRRVALKIIKPGMDSCQVVARFEAERQALAMMDHPNIAKVFDGGTIPFSNGDLRFAIENADAGHHEKIANQKSQIENPGRPYFVMELVKGAPITEYCDTHRLTTRQRLKLFLDVCHAVQHAHQKGIIHRDLKPSNILVSLHDVTPVVKVIDFGIAKATGGQLTDKTVYTELAQLIGTPVYMSPEQAGLSDLDVDTRSDVYSLGVLLYELLTGTTPFDGETLKKAGFDEMRRIIREEEPPRPSARLTTMEQAALSTIAEHRGQEAHQISGHVRGELDWIVMRALEKDRNRRYESASTFAADVQRYLDDEPVLACPPSLAYRLKKYTRRHRVGLLLGSALVALFAVLTGSVGWIVRDRSTRHQQLLGEVDYALQDADRDLKAEKWVEARAAVLRAQSLLSTGAGDNQLHEQAAGLMKNLDMVIRLNEIRLEGSAVKDEQFDVQSAQTSFAQAFRDYGIDVDQLSIEEAAERIKRSPIVVDLIAAVDSWAMILEFGDTRAKRLHALARQADPDKDVLRQELRQALEKGERQDLVRLAEEAQQVSLGPSTAIVVARGLLDENDLMQNRIADQGRVKLAVALLRQAQLEHPDDFWINYTLAYFLNHIQPPQLEEAIGFYRASLSLRPHSPVPWLYLGHALAKKGDLVGAIAAYQKAIGFEHYPESHNNLGNAFQEKGQLDEAIAEFREALRLKKDVPQVHLNLGHALQEKGRLDEAIAEYQEALRLKKDYPEAHNNLGHALQKKGRQEQALAEYQEALRLKKDSPLAHNNLGNLFIDKGQLDEALAEFREALRLKNDYPEAHYNLGIALHGKGRLFEAFAEYREGLRLKKNFPEAHYNLGNLLRDMGRLDEAIAEYQETLRLKKDLPEAHCNLADSLLSQDRFTEALAAFRRGHELGSQNPRWSYPSAQWVRTAEHLVALEGKLPKLLTGEIQPANAAECTTLASYCQGQKKLYLAAAQFYGQAFSTEAALADDLANSHRYNAACAAALAGCGLGKDAGNLAGEEYAYLRQQAMTWLNANLAAWRWSLDKDGDKVPAKVARTLARWQKDSDLAEVRDPDGLAKLPPEEQKAWRGLWAEVAQTLERARKPK